MGAIIVRCGYGSTVQISYPDMRTFKSLGRPGTEGRAFLDAASY